MFQLIVLFSVGCCFLIDFCSAVKNNGNAENGKSLNVDLLMPGVKPKEDNTYLCFAMKMNKTLYITGFKPKASMSVAHHILIYGCTDPGETDGVPWNCGEMESESQRYRQGPVCKSEQTIMYAWGMDAPALALPKQVAFKVGKSSDIPYMVLQIHYKDVSSFLPPKNEKDSSGVILRATTVAQPKLAGVYLLSTDGEIPPHSTTYMEAACAFNEDIILHPFGFRVHAHKHGQIVAGYRVRDGQWTEIGRKSPQQPQMFYPVEKPDLTITKGDILAARCTMTNDDDASVAIGPTTNDEMCNFYIMYYVEGNQAVKDRLCLSPGPPSWSWKTLDGIHAENAPRNASIIPNTDKYLQETRKQIKALDKEIEKQRVEMGQKFRNLLRNDISDRLRPANLERSNFLWEGEPIPERSNWERDGDFSRFRFEDAFNRFSLFDDPDISLDDERVAQLSDDDRIEEPSQTETFSVIDDKNGGKGYEKTRNYFKQLKVPGGNGFYKESRKESAFSWSSPEGSNMKIPNK